MTKIAEKTIPARYYKFAGIALELAALAEHDVTYQLCALVVSKNRVLSVGYNQPKTHPISDLTIKKQLHAEMDALLRCKDASGADIIVVRAKSGGRAGMAKPCQVCEKTLRRFGVRRVFYTVSAETSEIQLEEMKL